MLTINDKLKCDECGQFVSIDDLVTGKASHVIIVPESETTKETYETLCEDCCDD